MNTEFTTVEEEALKRGRDKTIYEPPKNLLWYTKTIPGHLALWSTVKGPFEVFTEPLKSEIKVRTIFSFLPEPVPYRDINHAQRIMTAVLHGKAY